MYQNIADNKRKSWMLIVGFVLLVSAIGYFVNYAIDSGFIIFGFAITISLVMSLVSWFAGDKMALKSARAKEITKADDPLLYTTVENLAITAGLPMPRLYLIPDQSLNAFATGRDPKHASLAVTAGLRNTLSPTELEGVIAHELSHIGNYDTRFLMLTIFLVGLVGLVADMFLYSDLDNDEGKSIPLLLVAFVVSLVGRLLAQLIHLAVSRRREFLADSSAVLLTRYPEGLINALTKISTDTKPSNTANSTMAPLYFSNPFPHSFSHKISNLFNSHPPIAERIAALQK